jgi:lysophospholipase L1-like esterase
VTPADESAAARASWVALRSQAPSAPIVVIGTWYRHPAFAAQQAAMQAALKAEFLAWGDTNAAFVDPHDGSITRGHGEVIRPAGAGWFTAANVPWAFPPAGGVYDGFHPSPAGVYQVLVPSLVDTIDAALTALGS